MSLDDLARDAGLSKSHLHAIEARRVKTPSADILFKIAETLGVTIDYLLGRQTRQEAEDDAFYRFYLLQPPRIRRKIREMANLLSV